MVEESCVYFSGSMGGGICYLLPAEQWECLQDRFVCGPGGMGVDRDLSELSEQIDRGRDAASDRVRGVYGVCSFLSVHIFLGSNVGIQNADGNRGIPVRFTHGMAFPQLY